MSERVDQIYADIIGLSPKAKLRVAAELIERGKTEIAEHVAELALQELQTARLFGKVPRQTLPDAPDLP